MGFLDESGPKAEWKCQDNCLKKKGKQLCGQTDHFTNFAVLLGGSVSGGNKGGKCGADSSNNEYVLGSWKNDLILTASVIGAMVVLGLLFIGLMTLTPLRRFLYGSEGMRIITLRKKYKERQQDEEPVEDQKLVQV